MRNPISPRRAVLLILCLVLYMIIGDGFDVASPADTDPHGEPKSAPELQALQTLRMQQAGNRLRLSIETPIDITAFPTVKTFVLVNDAQGGSVKNLEPNMFSIREQRIGSAHQVPASLEVRELATEVTKADIVFVVDQSGSMEDEITAVRNGIQEFADLLVQHQVDFRLGGVSYEGPGWGGIGVGTSTGGFVTDIEIFRQWARGIPALDGEERAYDAIVTVTQPPFLWRGDAQQILCLVTDENSDYGANGVTDAFNAIGQRQFFYFNTAVEYEALQETDRDFEQLGKRLGGAFNEQTLLDQLGELIISKYVVEYTSPWPEKDGVLRELTVMAKSPEDRKQLAQDTESYTPVAYGQIGGTVSDATTESAIQGANLTLVGSDGKIADQNISAADGSYGFGRVIPGKYTVRAERTRYQSTQRDIALQDEREIIADFELSPIGSNQVAKAEKQELIDLLRNVPQYVEEERQAQRYLDNLHLSTQEEEEALRRLILAEMFMKHAYSHAEQRAEVAGLAASTTLSYAVKDILSLWAIKKLIGNFLPKTMTVRFFGVEIDQSHLFMSIQEKVFGMIDVTIIEVSNRLIVYIVEVFPEVADPVAEALSDMLVDYLGELIGATGVEEELTQMARGRIEKWLLDTYGNWTDQFIAQSIHAASTFGFAGNYDVADQRVVGRLIIVGAETSEINHNVITELRNAEIAGKVQDVAGKTADATKLAAALSGGGVFGVISLVSEAIKWSSFFVKYGYSGYAAGTSMLSLLWNLPQQVNSGTAAAFGLPGTWPVTQPAPGLQSVTTLAGMSNAPPTGYPAAAPALTQAHSDLSVLLDELIDLILADRLAEALNLTHDRLLPASESFRQVSHTAESRILSVGGDAFEPIPLFELRYKKLATLSPQVSLDMLALLTDLVGFFWLASEVDSPQDSTYLQTKEDILIELLGLRDKAQEFTDELNGAEALIQGRSMPPTVVIDAVEVTSDGELTSIISRSPQDFRVEVTLRNVGTSPAQDIEVRLALSDDSTLSAVSRETQGVGYLGANMTTTATWDLQHVGPTVDVRNALTLSVEPASPEYSPFRTFPSTVLMVAAPPPIPTPPTGNSLANANIYAYPNPFNPQVQKVTIRYSLAKDALVTIKLYDSNGEMVTTLFEEQPRNQMVEYSETWNGRNERGDIVANGVYFYLITTSTGETAAGKIAVWR